MLLFVEGEDGLEPAMLWLTESGLQLRYTSWARERGQVTEGDYLALGGVEGALSELHGTQPNDQAS
ncbi:hypothetical protein [Streptomyces massasporeus]|uniref:hypothetical protein n=1 Tax=Streptomyces massasporeus TaxID=67324 RepID=UPI00345737EA